MKSLLAFIFVCSLAIQASGQINCDINGDGLGGSSSDLIYLINMLHMPPESFYACDIACDIDEDGDSMTIADMTSFIFYLRNPSDVPPFLTYRPGDDTIMVESAQASPGEQIFLSVMLNSIDSLISYELLIKINPQYLTIGGFNPNENLDFLFSFSPDLLHIHDLGGGFIMDSVFIQPGNYHLGDLVVNVNPDITEPVTTYIEFGSCPEDNFYTGLANMTFFVPVLVNGEITITPTAIDDENLGLPSVTSIEAYPNPFNSSVNLRVESDRADRLIIYDVLGREVASFKIKAGSNIITWNAVDNEGDLVNTGIYFTKLGKAQSTALEKLVYIK